MAKSYLIQTAVLTIAALLAIAAANRMINPLGVFPWNDSGPFAVKPALDGHVRLWKAHAVRGGFYRTVLLGNSRVEFGLDPQYDKLPQPAFNLGIPSASMDEIAAYFEHATTANPVEFVVLSLDIQLFSPDDAPEKDFVRNRLCMNGDCPFPVADYANALFSMDATAASLATLRAGSDEATQDIELFGPHGQRLSETRHKRSIYDNTCEYFRSKEELYYRPRFVPRSQDFTPANPAIKTLDGLLREAYLGRADVRIIVPPIHARLLEAILDQSGEGLVESYFRTLVDLNEKNAALASHDPFPIFSFMGYTESTAEPVPNKSGVLKNYWDPSHYTQELGELILNAVTQPSPFESTNPALLVPENVDAAVKQILDDRESWRQQKFACPLVTQPPSPFKS